MSGLDAVLNWLRGEKSPPSLGLEQAPALPSYPSQHDADYARNYGFGDNASNEDYLNNNKARILGIQQTFQVPTKRGAASESREIFIPASAAGSSGSAIMSPQNSAVVDLNKKPELQGDLRNIMMQAALAANRSPIAAMGFDPSRVIMDTEIKNPNVGGLYRPSADMMYVPAAMHDSIVHESTHRGFQKLREKYPEQVGKLMQRLPDEEMVVRALMASKGGDPEGMGGAVDAKQRQSGIDLMSTKANAETLRQLEELAIQDRLTRSRRSGPQ